MLVSRYFINIIAYCYSKIRKYKTRYFTDAVHPDRNFDDDGDGGSDDVEWTMLRHRLASSCL